MSDGGIECEEGEREKEEREGQQCEEEHEARAVNRARKPEEPTKE